MRRLFEVAQANGQMSQGSFNPAEANSFSAVVVENFDGVTVEDGDDGAGKVGGPQFAGSHEQIKNGYRN